VRWNRHNVGMISGFSAAIGTLVPHADDWTTGSRVTRAFAPVPNYYPAVVSVADFELAQAQTLRTKGGHGSVDHLVRQLAICGCCGAPMRGLRRGQAEFSSVVCSAAIMGIGCTYHQIEFAPLERTLKLRLPLELFSHMDDDIVIVQSNILNKAQNEVDRARRTWSEATSQDSDDNHLTVQSGALWEEVVASENHLLDTVEGYQQKRTKKMRVRIAIALELLALPVWTTNETARLNKLLRLLFKAIVVHPHGGGMDLVFLDGRQQHLAIA
jgi:hypothetical protein